MCLIFQISYRINLSRRIYITVSHNALINKMITIARLIFFIKFDTLLLNTSTTTICQKKYKTISI